MSQFVVDLCQSIGIIAIGVAGIHAVRRLNYLSFRLSDHEKKERLQRTVKTGGLEEGPSGKQAKLNVFSSSLGDESK